MRTTSAQRHEPVEIDRSEGTDKRKIAGDLPELLLADVAVAIVVVVFEHLDYRHALFNFNPKLNTNSETNQ